MSREWKPGDVASLSIGGETVPAMVVNEDESLLWRIAGHSFFKAIAVGNDVLIQSARPLAVIDLEPHAAEFVIHVLEKARHSWTLKVADALRSLIAPPKPEEPQGLGAVVEDRRGEQWSRVRSHPEGRRCWQRDSDAVTPVQYRDIDAVRVLSKGVTA